MTDATVVEATAPGPDVAAATAIESSPAAAGPAAVADTAAAPSTVVSDAAIVTPPTVVEDVTDTTPAPPPDETVVEFPGRGAHRRSGDAPRRPRRCGRTSPGRSGPVAGCVNPGGDRRGRSGHRRSIDQAARHLTAGGRQKAIAAVLVAAVLLGGGLLGYAAVNGGGSGGGTAGSSPTPGPSVAVVQSAAPGTYIALAGDTLATIAAKLGVTIEQLLAINPGLSGGIVIGESILIPLDEPTAAATPTPSSMASITPSATPVTSIAPTVAPTIKPPAAPVIKAGPTVTPLDTHPPTGTVRVNGTSKYAGSKSVTLTLSGKDDRKVTKMRISNGTSRGSAVEFNYANSKAWKLTGDAGKKTVSVWYYDGRNWSGRVSDAIIYDRSPVLTASKYWDYQTTPSSACTHYLQIIPGAATDPDGNDTISIASVGNASLGSIEKRNRTDVTYHVPDNIGFETVTFTFSVADEFGRSVSETGYIYLAPIPPGGC